MDALSAVLANTVAIALLFEAARRIGVPYPSLFVLGGRDLDLEELRSEARGGAQQPLLAFWRKWDIVEQSTN